MGGKAVPPSAKPTENNKRLRTIVNKSEYAGPCLRILEKGFSDRLGLRSAAGVFEVLPDSGSGAL